MEEDGVRELVRDGEDDEEADEHRRRMHQHQLSIHLEQGEDSGCGVLCWLHQVEVLGLRLYGLRFQLSGLRV